MVETSVGELRVALRTLLDWNSRMPMGNGKIGTATETSHFGTVIRNSPSFQ
jgi:hypothetical protein